MRVEVVRLPIKDPECNRTPVAPGSASEGIEILKMEDS